MKKTAKPVQVETKKDQTTVNDVDQQIDQAFLEETPIKKQSKKNVWIEPITKKKLIIKLIPFMIVCTLILAFFILCFVLPSVLSLQGNQKLSLYLFAPISLIVFSPFAFYAFDRPYCQYNLKHNEKMKKLLGKMFVKYTSANGCFELRNIYLDNPNQLAWMLNGEKIVADFAKWDPEGYKKAIKDYKEITI